MTNSLSLNSKKQSLKTKIIKIDPNRELISELKEAIELIKNNELVAFPTETVYGLGANALDEQAVKKIFKAKGRPSDNPIITHISSLTMFKAVVKEPFNNQIVDKLIKTFWPGPLTLILPKADKIPYSTTGSLETIAVRMPSHFVALALIEGSNLPIAAPSANLSGKPSPTTAQDVFDDMNGRIGIIIDGGPTEIGLESTVLDVSTVIEKPTILRPGKITKEQIESCLGIEIEIYNPTKHRQQDELLKPKSPGMKYRHYAPNADLVLVSDLESFKRFYMAAKAGNKKIGLIISEMFKKLVEESNFSLEECIKYIYNSNEDLGSNLYLKLREMDKNKVDLIITFYKEQGGFGKAIINRLSKASTKK